MSAAAGWTTPHDLRAQVQRLWDKGRLLAPLAGAEDPCPIRLVLKAPRSAELSERFDEVRAWSAALQQAATQGFRLVMREVRHRVIGHNAVPDEVWIDALDDALRLVGRHAEARRFAELAEFTRASQPLLVPWLQAHALLALALADDWPRLLSVVSWLQSHPRPAVYLRQVDLPGVHSKFIEMHRAVLAELLDMALPADAVDPGASGIGGFVQRYGFLGKPVRIRLRVLDASGALLGTGAGEDLTLDHDSFARLNPPVSRVFMTENEVNFLAFPPVPQALVIFGAGYGFEMLSQARWLHGKAMHYWGDIDTHGFAILHQLRERLPQAQSFLMDRDTLMAHRALWTDEPQPLLRDLPSLSAEERSLFDDLRWRRLDDGRQVRLEQERIAFHWVERALEGLLR